MNEKLEKNEQDMKTLSQAFENISEAMAGFNLTYKPKDTKQLKYENLANVLTELRQNTNRVRYAAYGVKLEDMANALKVKIQEVDDFEKGVRYDFKMLVYYYYKMIEIYGVKNMEKISEQYDEYMHLEFGYSYDTYKQLTK